ncbi:uncharacterized protein EI90DRAFT_74756 [Cantharellus anzutake]|uniref:uncharacterized protein n=1 Tax=Cantharellus anzutake TaxID=1750568 RepID=UPI0019068248|nr:uncharacterized protein EI90DRAFT_74756 [Cantharellus anzutake]KAF8336828.1 hypothetical protein EI90DRAFT_74756 [Cantharellus anzutake]
MQPRSKTTCRECPQYHSDGCLMCRRPHSSCSERAQGSEFSGEQLRRPHPEAPDCVTNNSVLGHVSCKNVAHAHDHLTADACLPYQGNNLEPPNSMDTTISAEGDAKTSPENDNFPVSYAGIELIVDHTTRDVSDHDPVIRKQNFPCALKSPNRTLAIHLLQDPLTMQYLQAFAARYPTLRRIVIRTDSLSIPGNQVPGNQVSLFCGHQQTDPVIQLGDHQGRRNFGCSDSADLVSSHL